MKRALATVAVGAAALSPIVITAPAHAASSERCKGFGDMRVCASVRKVSGGVQGVGYAETGNSPELRVNANRITLQRRHCGGRWVTWTTKQSPARHRGVDGAVTTAVKAPKHYQFRTITNAKLIRLVNGHSEVVDAGRVYSKVWGSCS